jgi:hypothetical protein
MCVIITFAQVFYPFTYGTGTLLSYFLRDNHINIGISADFFGISDIDKPVKNIL